MSISTSGEAIVRHWARAIAVGAVLALAFGVLIAWRNPDRDFWPQVVVFAATAWPILSGAAQWLWFDRESVEAEIDSGRESIEYSWHQEAAATSFYSIVGGLIALETLGDVAQLAWLSPIGLIHVLVVGGLTYVGSFVYLRAKHT